MSEAKKPPHECRKVIRSYRNEIDTAYYNIRELAREYIPDFHFLNHEVSTTWSCVGSPIGMCVYNIDQTTGKRTVCRYCGGPVERK